MERFEDDAAVGSQPKRLSIIIPTYNRQRSISRTLQSIGPTDCEVIVVDDGSTDETVSAAERAMSDAKLPRGQVVCQKNAGPGAARNTGAAIAHGNYLAFLDSDDLWFPHTLPRLVKLLAEQDSAPSPAALIFLQNKDFPASDPPTSEPDSNIATEIFRDYASAAQSARNIRFGSCNVVIRRDVYAALSGFTTQTRHSEDTDLFLRVDAPDLCCLLVRSPTMVAYETGGGDQLTGSLAGMLQGLDFVIGREVAGHYPGGRHASQQRSAVLAKMVSSAILLAFAAGHMWTAYARYIRHFPVLLRGREWHWMVRLPLVPLLHLLRPQSFRFRFSPPAKSAQK